ncbi:hypothetical protein [Dyadobacter chenhuakuii]|uniref:C1q domain-containing protein n=1 Tax=Dyadobacter chenhuakuii TaxID=2909339 RepID=A0ABY4XF80_9BACT|nr:hypothetical protein [Dyadobacter chenhuakuii]MCF2491747.1 hypothetical protein [Dyadobacter chenhuakuii]USJ29089.1 hypothetical protein NFI80_14520 [Dyadobacter chenhuakuii]
MRTFHLPSFSNQKLKLTFGKLALSAILLSYGPGIFAQNVGINTQQPDPSSALDIVGTDKGLLIPRVSLQSLTDNATIPNPATALLVYNTNAGLGKVGFYYNSGTAASPVWSLVGGGEGGNLTLPFSQNGSSLSSLFHINNTGGISVGSAITGESESSIGVKGVTNTGRAVVGTSNGSGVAVSGYAVSDGTGVIASAANTNGKALEVSGPMKIAGPGQSPGNGKVLMSDGSGNATWENVSGNVAFRASGIKGGGSELIPVDGTQVKITFAGENYDVGDNYQDANGFPHSTFTAPKAGLYHFDAQVEFFNYNDTGGNPVPKTFEQSLQIIVTRGNSTFNVATNNTVMTLRYSSTISTDLKLLAGDKVHLIASSTATYGPTTLTTMPEKSFFSGRLVFEL